MTKHNQTWSDDDIAYAIRLRQTMKPEEIAPLVGRTEASVSYMLSVEKHKRGITYPRLRHGNLRYDKAAIQQWRNLARTSNYKEIKKKFNVHPVYVSYKFAADLRGEVVF